MPSHHGFDYLCGIGTDVLSKKKSPDDRQGELCHLTSDVDGGTMVPVRGEDG